MQLHHQPVMGGLDLFGRRVRLDTQNFPRLLGRHGAGPLGSRRVARARPLPRLLAPLGAVNPVEIGLEKLSGLDIMPPAFVEQLDMIGESSIRKLR